MINKAMVKKHFGQYAKQYDQYAKVQQVMAVELLRKLNLQGEFFKILELGCGTGYLTERLLARFPQAELTAVDLAPQMLEQTEARVGRGRVKLVCDDLETMQLSEKYDLIISSATFQWLNQPARVVEKLLQALATEGVLAVATFGAETFTELHQAYQKAGLSLGETDLVPPGQKFLTLAEWERIFAQIFSEQRVVTDFSESFYYEYFPTARDFLQAVKKIGASNSNLKRNRYHRSLLWEMLQIYDTEFRVADQIPVTYQLLFFSCKLVTERMTVFERATS